MKISEAFEGFLEAEDIPEGKDIEVTIEYVRESTQKDKGKDGRPIGKPIIKFQKVKKEMILNKTNARSIRRHHGNETGGWEGKKISIYRSKCNAFGDPETPCIRVRGKTL